MCYPCGCNRWIEEREVSVMGLDEIQSSKFKINNSTGIRPIIGISLTLVIFMRSLIQMSRNDHSHRLLFYIGCVWFIVCLGLLAIPIYRLFMKPTVLIINPDSLFINGRTVEASEIKTVMVRGTFQSVIGIKPIRNKIVPIHLCFRFQGDEDKGMAELSRWAERNGIPFVHKHFTSWV